MCARGLVVTAAACTPAIALALTQSFAEPTTIGATARVQMFEQQPTGTLAEQTFSTISVVLSETDQDTSPTPLLPPLRRGVEASAIDAGTSAATDLTAVGMKLPVRADRTSTATQRVQLLRFERRNQIAEAFLLARDLVNRDGTDEFAIDAAIRTSLVLGRTADVEALYRRAISTARLPGKYFVQLTHWYLRTGQDKKVAQLILDFEKAGPRDADYFLTLSRMHTIAENARGTRAVIEQAGKQTNELLFPQVLLASQTYRTTQNYEAAARIVDRAANQDLGPWEQRMLLLEYLKLPGLTAEGVVRMVDSALVNEPSYQRARALADRVLDRVTEERIFFPLRSLLLQKVMHDEASDIERWFAALTYLREGEEENALRILQGGLPLDALPPSDSAVTTGALGTSEEDFMGGTTPVIAFERALALARAGRPQESVSLAANLLAEQPSEWSIRLLLAEQQLQLRKPSESLNTVLNWPVRHELKSEERLRRVTVATSAALALNREDLLATVWSDLAREASFEELLAMRDVVIHAVLPPPSPTEVASLRERLENLVSQQPHLKTPGLWFLRGALAGRHNDKEAELDCYKKYADLQRDHPSALRFAAEQASRYASVQLEIQPAPNRSVPIRATDSQVSEIALRYFRNLLVLQPRIASHYASLMRLYLMRGEAETARRMATELLDRESSSPEALRIAAHVLHDTGFAADALALYRPLVEKDLGDYELWARFAGALRNAGRADIAEQILRKILTDGLAGKPYAQTQVLETLAAIATESNTKDQLADYLDSLRPVDLPDKPSFLLGASRILVALNLPARAIPFLTEYRTLYGEGEFMPAVLLLEARTQAAQNLQMAEGLYEELANEYSTSPLAIIGRMEQAELRRRGGRPAEAVDLLVQLASAYPDDDRAAGALVAAAQVAAEELKDPSRARTLLQQFLQSDCQDFPLRRQARARLKKLSSGPSPTPQPLSSLLQSADLSSITLTAGTQQ